MGRGLGRGEARGGRGLGRADQAPGEQGPGGKVNQEEVGAWAAGSMGQTGCEEAGDPGPWMVAAGGAQPWPATTAVTPVTGRLGQLLVGSVFPGESCEGWWSRQGEVLRTEDAR